MKLGTKSLNHFSANKCQEISLNGFKYHIIIGPYCHWPVKKLRIKKMKKIKNTFGYFNAKFEVALLSIFRSLFNVQLAFIKKWNVMNLKWFAVFDDLKVLKVHKFSWCVMECKDSSDI